MGPPWNARNVNGRLIHVDVIGQPQRGTCGLNGIQVIVIRLEPTFKPAGNAGSAFGFPLDICGRQ
jgi:hypothetical protein